MLAKTMISFGMPRNFATGAETEFGDSLRGEGLLTGREGAAALKLLTLAPNEMLLWAL